MSDTLRIGSRGSPLALAQTEEVVARLRAVHPSLRPEIVVLKTHGDDGYRSDLGTALDGKRAFTKRIEEALLEGRIDAAVHSLKDVPTERVEGLVLAAIPDRADPRDAFVANGRRSLANLPAGTRVGTSSLRRRAQLLARWPSLEIVELHGNVGTRLRRLDAEEFDAIVVAAAGLTRLGLSRQKIEPIDPDVVMPAPGQGALGVQARADDERVKDFLASIDDPNARRVTEAERLLSARIGGACNVPVGALATLEGDVLTLRAVVASPDGQRLARASAHGPATDPGDVVHDVERRLLDRGADEILREAR